jgi:peptide/nickel transport system permease protein
VTAVIEPDRARSLHRRGRRKRRWSLYTLAGGLVLVTGVPVAALVVQVFGLLPGPMTADLTAVLQPPSSGHPFGTDELGRDLLSRVLAAVWLDYGTALVLTYVPMAVGMVLGGVAGYAGGWVDVVIMRLADVAMAFPFIVMTVGIVAVVGPGLKGIYFAFFVVGWAFSARLTQAQMLVLREQQYIAAARTLGLPTWRILCVHALPNLLRPNLVTSMATLVTAILGMATLSYLGLGVQPPQPEWGAIVSEGQEYLFTHWWVATLPGLVIAVVGLGFSLIGDGLADLLGESAG